MRILSLLPRCTLTEAMGIIQQDISLWDPKVCRPFVAGVCQHDLFTNTVSRTFRRLPAYRMLTLGSIASRALRSPFCSLHARIENGSRHMSTNTFCQAQE